MLDELAVEVVKQVPALVVLAWVVRHFLKSAAETRDRMLDHEAKRDADLNDTLKRMSDGCHEVQRDSLGVMRETKEELGRTREASTQLVQYLRAQNERGKRETG